LASRGIVPAVLCVVLAAFTALGIRDAWNSQRRQYSDYAASIRPHKAEIRRCRRADPLDPDLCGHAPEIRELVDWVNGSFAERDRPVIDSENVGLRRQLRLFTHTAYRERTTACRIQVQRGIIASYVPGLALVRINDVAVLAVPAPGPLALTLEEAVRRCTPAKP